MIETIKTKLAEWRHGLQQLQQRRAELQQALAQCETDILRNQGAILAGEELLKVTQGDAGEGDAGGVPVA